MSDANLPKILWNNVLFLCYLKTFCFNFSSNLQELFPDKLVTWFGGYSSWDYWSNGKNVKNKFVLRGKLVHVVKKGKRSERHWKELRTLDAPSRLVISMVVFYHYVVSFERQFTCQVDWSHPSPSSRRLELQKAQNNRNYFKSPLCSGSLCVPK